jgi:two-component system response regulator HupR/HoxA
LINHFLTKYSLNKTLNAERLTPDALRLLTAYPWPGNVRELENEIKRVNALYPGLKTITEEMLSESIRNYITVNSNVTIKKLTDVFHRKLIEDALKKNNGNITETARQLGFSRYGFYKKMGQLKMATACVTKK